MNILDFAQIDDAAREIDAALAGVKGRGLAMEKKFYKKFIKLICLVFNKVLFYRKMQMTS